MLTKEEDYIKECFCSYLFLKGGHKENNAWSGASGEAIPPYDTIVINRSRLQRLWQVFFVFSPRKERAQNNLKLGLYAWFIFRL